MGAQPRGHCLRWRFPAAFPMQTASPSRCPGRCPLVHAPCLCFVCSYEDGQVGDANINTQEGGIHKEILRVIGNQTATG